MNKTQLLAALDTACERVMRAERDLIGETEARDRVIGQLRDTGMGSLQIAMRSSVTQRRVQQILKQNVGRRF